MIKEAYCSYEVSKLLKEKGFLKEVDLRMTQNLSFYDNIGLSHNLDKYYDRLIQDKIDFVIAPTHQMAMAWLREKGIHISPKYCCFQGPKKNDKPYYKWEDRVLKLSTGEQIHPDVLGIHEYYSSYEEAIEAALNFCIKNLI